MQIKMVGVYRCPFSHEELTLSVDKYVSEDVIEGRLTSESGYVYEIENGIPNLIYPRQLKASDAEFQEKYDRGAEQYEIGSKWLYDSFYQDENSMRASMIDLLNLNPDMRVLEIGCGTGKDSLVIANRLNGLGQLFLLEISRNILEISRRQVTNVSPAVEFLLGNGSYLPFPDRYFDAVFHFGGVNTFSELKRAFNEMTRVARIGAEIVVGDEGIAPWLRETLFGQILIAANPLYKYQVPLECLPECARNVEVRWILGNAFYLIKYQVGEGSPRVDLDLPIPGRGDSLRTRYGNWKQAARATCG